MKDFYTKEDKECTHCAGNLSPHLSGDKIIIWCDLCGSNSPKSQPNVEINFSTPTQPDKPEYPSECCGKCLDYDLNGGNLCERYLVCDNECTCADKPEGEERFEKEFKGKLCNCVMEYHEKGIDCPSPTTIYNFSPNEIKSFIRSEKQRSCNETLENLKIGQLRQWLNEDRITDLDKMVTNEDLKLMLGIITGEEFKASKSNKK